jgi:hypothetical protein
VDPVTNRRIYEMGSTRFDPHFGRAPLCDKSLVRNLQRL